MEFTFPLLEPLHSYMRKITKMNHTELLYLFFFSYNRKFTLGKQYKVTLTSAFSLDQNGNGRLRHEFCSSHVDDEIRGDISEKFNFMSFSPLFKNFAIQL